MANNFKKGELVMIAAGRNVGKTMLTNEFMKFVDRDPDYMKEPDTRIVFEREIEQPEDSLIAKIREHLDKMKQEMAVKDV